MNQQPTFSPRQSGEAFFLAILLLLFACTREDEATSAPHPGVGPTKEDTAQSVVGRRGGRLVIGLRAEPKTFNPISAVDSVSQTVIDRIMGDLVHINRFSQKPEPAAAESWEISEDGRRFTLRLRRDMKFSDGHSLDADDVLFSFRVYLDEETASKHRDELIVGGTPLKVRKVDSHTLDFESALPYARGVSLFDSIFILPQHLLDDKGDLGHLWGVGTPEAQIAGLGPFKVKEYVPGERLVLGRNEYYWKFDQNGLRLPYLDEIAFLFVATDDAQVLSFQAGETDLIVRLSAANFALLEQEQSRREFQVFDLGPSLEYAFLFFNLNDLDPSSLPGLLDKQIWFRELAFRKAVSLAIDRESIKKLVFNGRATSLGSSVSPGNKLWFNSRVQGDYRRLEEARRLLKSAGFHWNDEQKLIDSEERPVVFSVITSSSNSQRSRMATILQDDLRELGMQVNVVPMEHRSVVDRVTRSFDYEACILAAGAGDVDPNGQLNMLLTSGNRHFWHLGQSTPATEWEAEIDELMRQQLTVVDYARRKQLFDRVQELLAENLPFIVLASPHLLVGAKRGLGNLKPAVLEHALLWNVDELFWKQADSRPN